VTVEPVVRDFHHHVRRMIILLAIICVLFALSTSFTLLGLFWQNESNRDMQEQSHTSCLIRQQQIDRIIQKDEALIEIEQQVGGLGSTGRINAYQQEILNFTGLRRECRNL
jgi:hypothetical protein